MKFVSIILVIFWVVKSITSTVQVKAVAVYPPETNMDFVDVLKQRM
jgi:hypothetical protein